MINLYRNCDERLSFVSRNLSTNLKSIAEQFKITLKIAGKKSLEVKSPSSKFHITELITFIEMWLESISIAESEADLMMNFSKYLLIMDLECAKLKLHIKYILKENEWLKSEMYDLQGILMRIEHQFLLAEAEKKFFQYFFNMRNYSRISSKSAKSETNNEFLDDEESDPEEEIPYNLHALFNVVTQFISESRHTVAISWCQKSIGDYQKQYGEMSVEVGAIYNLLGRVYKDFEYYIIAQECFEKALIIRQKIHGKNSDQVGTTLTLLGSVLGKRKLFKEAIQMCKQALSIRENIHNKTHIDLLRLNLKIAEYLLELHSWTECITFYKMALTHLDTIFDPTESLIIKGYTNLAKAYIEINILNKGADCLEKVNSAYVKKNNPGVSMNSSPFAVIQDCLKRNVAEFHAETLMQKFGTVSEISDENVLAVMIFYYEKLHETKTVELLKSWLEISNRNINQAEIHNTKLHGRMDIGGKINSLQESSASQSSIRQSLLGIFKGKK